MFIWWSVPSYLLLYYIRLLNYFVLVFFDGTKYLDKLSPFNKV